MLLRRLHLADSIHSDIILRLSHFMTKKD